MAGTSVLFVGNPCHYGTMSFGLLDAMASNGVEAYYRSNDMSADTAARYDNSVYPNHNVSVATLNPDVVHIAIPDAATNLRVQQETKYLKHVCPNAKFIVSIDGVNVQPRVVLDALEVASQVIIPHGSIFNAFMQRGEVFLGSALAEHETHGRLHVVSPSVFSPRKSAKTIERECVAAKQALSQQHALDVGAYFYAPNLFDPFNMGDLVSRKFVPHLTDSFGRGALVFVVSSDPKFASNPKFAFSETTGFITVRPNDTGDESPYSVLNHFAMDWTSGEEAEATNAILALFPPEANSTEFVSVPYAQLYLQALAAGAVTVVSPAFVEQKLAVPISDGAFDQTGYSFVAKDNTGDAFKFAVSEAREFLKRRRSCAYLPQILKNMMGKGCDDRRMAQAIFDIYNAN